MKNKNKQYGQHLLQISDRVLKRGRKLRFVEGHDTEADKYLKMVYEDGRDIYMIGLLLINGKLRRAYNKIWKLHPDVRDNIPVVVVNYLERVIETENEYGFSPLE